MITNEKTVTAKINFKTKNLTNNSESRYDIYRVLVDGEPSIVIQSDNCCMLDNCGVLTKQTLRTIQNEMGEQATRAILNGQTVHFHMNIHELMKKITDRRSAPTSLDNSDEESKKKKKKTE